MFFFLLKFVSLGDPFTCTPTPRHHPTLCPTTAFVEDTTVRWDIHRGRKKKTKNKKNTRRRLTFGRTACGGWNGYPRSDWTATWRDEGFPFFFFTGHQKNKKNKTLTRRHSGSPGVHFLARSLSGPIKMPPSLRSPVIQPDKKRKCLRSQGKSLRGSTCSFRHWILPAVEGWVAFHSL